MLSQFGDNQGLGVDMKRILLVAPLFEAGFKMIEQKVMLKKAFLAPLPIVTIAGLTPPEIDVDLWDEAVQGPIGPETALDREYDLVGITGYTTQIRRVIAISREFRRRGVAVAIGGPGASVAPDQYSELADFVFIGEAEYTWPQFLKEWENGTARPIYRQVLKPDLADSPVPRWDLLKTDLSPYSLGAVQDSRGCPYDCHFCDVPYLFGQRLRAKPPANICKEIEMQRQMGADGIFFCNDNFVGDLKYARTLLKELVQLNNSFDKPVQFFTDLTVNVAKHDDILELLADSNFGGLFIGIESPSKENLKETHKVQNLYTDIVQDVKKIQSYALPVTAGIIVGFDHDTVDVFDEQFKFLQEAGIPMPMVSILCAPHGTKLRERLLREGRVLAGDENPIHRPSDDFSPTAINTNIIPLRMTRVELFRGFLSLCERLRDWNNFSERIIRFIETVERKPNVKEVELPPDAWKKASEFMASLDQDARMAVTRIIQQALPKPYVLPKVFRLIVMNHRERQMLDFARTRILTRIEKESAPDFKLEVSKRQLHGVPSEFVSIYQTLLPEVYDQVKTDLVEKMRVEDVTVRVFSEFLRNRVHDISSVEDVRPELLTTCASVVTKENAGAQATAFAVVGSSDLSKSKLADDIFNHIERDLRLHRSPDVSPESGDRAASASAG
jgi:radical SAM superfamily enzyme YgiQ (UPF0313 family)